MNVDPAKNKSGRVLGPLHKARKIDYDGTSGIAVSPKGIADVETRLLPSVPRLKLVEYVLC